jgi:SAM-dependent methyltransferase
MTAEQSVPERLGRAPCCGTENAPVFLSGMKDLLTTTSPGGTFSLRYCAACGVLYVDPRPLTENLHLYYPEAEYMPLPDASRSDRCSPVRELLKAILSWPYTVRFGSASVQLTPNVPGASLLDVGCGRGEMMKQMAARGWDVYGCDAASGKIASIAAAFGPGRAWCGTFEEIDFPLSSLDAIIMWHVIEHFPDPWRALRKAHALLKPGGKLVVGTPNWDCREARLFRRFWVGFDAPRHVVVFSTRSLCRALEDAGFEVYRLRPSLWANSVSESIVLALSGLLNVRLWNSRLSRALHYLLFPFFVLSRTLGNLSMIEITARKPCAVDPAT